MLPHRERRATPPGGSSAPPLRVRPQKPGSFVACLRVASATRLRHAPSCQASASDHGRCRD
ncbi:MAG: hypothetical protein AVDCRST_MAG39-783 [uncultured Sphingomonadaceae bacterium]|uniref:Uncharacterized protein n=1 Tax=uncultured Sphingomonadaceae bacterium TaxID=169976 RepID=A0A6J4S5W0_9SPHN|nr:MAG: hypothetical protein AVDCRST_MAG39-783 [uncultured Sphingomonadaceae bacterium]